MAYCRIPHARGDKPRPGAVGVFDMHTGVPLESSRPGRRRRGARPVVHAILIAVLTMLAGLGCAAAGSAGSLQDYRLGRGLALPALDLKLSGYASLRLRDLEAEEARLDLRDLSVFASWNPVPRWQVFAEVEVEDTFSVDGDGLNASDTEVAVERLYVDHLFADTLTLRAGRYLTPFGRWNSIHADPLVWTVSRPLVTSLAIPDHGTGAAAFGTFSLARSSLEYSVYVDDSDDLDPVNGEASFEDLDIGGVSNDFDHGIGAQLRLHLLDDRLSLGVSYADFDFHGIAGQRHLFGLDARWRWRRLEFSGEAAYDAGGTEGRKDDWGAFIQAVAPLTDHLYAVGRFEHYRSGILERQARRGSVGLTYRPQPAISLKFEYDAGSDEALAPDGWQISASVLF